MRIGIFTETYTPYISGLVTSVDMLKKALEKMGHTVYVVTANLESYHYEYDEKQKVLKIPGIPTGIYNARLTSIYPIQAINKIKSWNLDIIHSQTEFAIGTFARLFGKQYGIPVVHTYHTMYEDYVHYITRGHFNKPSKKLVEYLTLFYCDKTITELIVPTKKAYDLFKEKYNVKRDIYIIPTGIEVERFHKINTDISKVNRIKNTTTPSFLYRFENNLYITVEYDKRDQYKSVGLGRLFLMKDFFPRLIVLEDFEVLLKSANSLRLPVNYKLKYSMISYDQMIENVVLNLKTVLDNYDKLYELSKPEFDAKEQRLEKHLVKDVSTMSLDEIEKESSQIIYKPKADEIKYSKLTHYERKLKEESDMLRSQHSIPKNIYTQFEYNQLQKKKYNFKLRIVLWCLIEFIALSIFMIGLINNHWFVNNDVIYFVFIVTSLALTGLFVLTGLKVKRIEYFLGPVLCYFLPFIFILLLHL